MFQQKLAEKETKYIKLDNELRTKKKEFEKLQIKLEELGKGSTDMQRDYKQGAGFMMRVNNHQ